MRVSNVSTYMISVTDFENNQLEISIVLTGDTTHSPIVTHSHYGYTSKSFQPSKQGVIYQDGTEPEGPPGQAQMGFPPLRMMPVTGSLSNSVSTPSTETTATTQNEGLEKGACVNYGDVMTVQYNIKVLFVGEIAEDHKELLQNAVNECWKLKRVDSGLGSM
ncbi:hypothetical protein N0V82_008606 [Gnomoniopsis sp. IMI 355080]|nr:hypothetical protein N0V82_008606 [Gnomoniopsis sp. IMI 355080]